MPIDGTQGADVVDIGSHRRISPDSAAHEEAMLRGLCLVPPPCNLGLLGGEMDGPCRIVDGDELAIECERSKKVAREHDRLARRIRLLDRALLKHAGSERAKKYQAMRLAAFEQLRQLEVVA